MKFFTSQRVMMGIGLIVLTNAIVLLGVAYNRSGEPVSHITLTERELKLPFQYGLNTENSGLQLRLDFRTKMKNSDNNMYRFLQSPDWLDKNKLELLGFNFSDTPLTTKDKIDAFRGRSKEVVFVLEYNGETYLDQLNTARLRLDEFNKNLAAGLPASKGNGYNDPVTNYEREKNSASRLFVIDADLDGDQLRKRYPDKNKYMLMKGLVGVRLEDTREEHPKIVGVVKSLSNSNVHVPFKFHSVLESVLDEGDIKRRDKSPTYEVVINVGQRLEPWLIDIKSPGKDALN